MATRGAALPLPLLALAAAALLLAALAAPPLAAEAACARGRERFLTAPAQALMCSPWNAGACGPDASVAGRLYLGDASRSPAPDLAANNTDPYYLEKVVAGPNRSSLRITINDDADESLQVWGDSCAQGDCAGPGAMRHAFWASGDAEHTGAVRAGTALCVGGECLSRDELVALKRAAR